MLLRSLCIQFGSYQTRHKLPSCGMPPCTCVGLAESDADDSSDEYSTASSGEGEGAGDATEHLASLVTTERGKIIFAPHTSFPGTGVVLAHVPSRRTTQQ